MSHRFSLNPTLPAVPPEILELTSGAAEHDRVALDTWNGNDAPLATAPAQDPLPSNSIFVPEGYEPNYAYPLIIWILDPASDEHELCRLMAQVSTRNYFGLALRTPLARNASAARNSETIDDELNATQFLVEDTSTWEFEQQVFDAVLCLRNEYHIHSERVYLAGFDAAGTLALRVGLRRPDWFAGVAAFAAKFPSAIHPLSRFRDLRGKRVLLAWGEHHLDAAATNHYTGRLLHTAGMRVCLRSYDAGLEVTRPMLRDLDRWVMREIYEPATLSEI